MRIRRGLAAALFAIVAGGATAAAAQEEITVKGEVLDLSCYLSHGLKGRTHKSCAEQCAKRGLPIGVLAEGGEVYLLLEDHNNTEPYEDAKKLAGTKAEVKGKKYNKGGMNGIVVGAAKGE